MRRPASFEGDWAREATPLGNGRTGILVGGGIGTEHIIFNRTDMWHRAYREELPDMSALLPEMRNLMDDGNYADANHYMYDALKEKGFHCNYGLPQTLGELTVSYDTDSLFSKYRRLLHMDTGECEIVYDQKTRHAVRKCFISRKNDVFYYEYSATEPTDIVIGFDVYDDQSPDTEIIKKDLENGLLIEAKDNNIIYRAKSKFVECAAAISVYGADCKAENGKLHISGTYFRMAIKCFSGNGARKKVCLPEDFDYAEKLAAHTRLHKKLFCSANITLARGTQLTTEDLLNEAYDDKASPELIEKMWRFGRYLFISGTVKNGLPFPLYGIWHTKYFPMWAQHVANENVQIIHWHTVAGGLSELMLPLIHYYCDDLSPFRDMASKLYGCKGIFIDGYSSPVNKGLCEYVPVIMHFTGCAGWLSRHFYKYYKTTGDRRTLDERIFPFMLAAADFYLDYIRYDKSGKIVLYPTVSPENTPANLHAAGVGYLGHPCTPTKNATIEIAIVKDLFGNILDLIDETGEHAEYKKPLLDALSAMPEYMINSDGAIKEWTDPDLEDYYFHRHVSHIYPVFPGEEVTKESDPGLFAAFEKAVDLRKLGGQSGWSLSHTASIYAAMGRGERVAECLDTLFKGCTLTNLMTLHNDYRNMGVTLTWDHPPIQLDADMGAVNAVQMMLLDERGGFVRLLQAVPDRLYKGSFTGLTFTCGKINCTWNKKTESIKATVRITRGGAFRLLLPDFAKAVKSISGTAKHTVNGSVITVNAEKGDTLTVII